MQKENRNIWRTFNIYYRYTRKSGLLSFVISNLVKVAAIIAVVILAVWILNSFIIQVSDIPRFLIENFRTEVVLLFFLFTESFLGLIPPDFFILWVSEMSNFYLWVGLLGLLSYMGGFFAYYLGFAVSKLPKWKNRLLKFYAKHLDNIKKWGVVFIIIAALFPLPYATVCTLAGILRFPVRRLGYIGLFRIARFFIYAPIVAGSCIVQNAFSLIIFYLGFIQTVLIRFCSYLSFYYFYKKTIMIILLSPAKSLDFERPLQTKVATIPEFIQQANKLASELQKYSISQLNELMGISNNLAMLNFGRFQNWHDNVKNLENKQAVRAFIGEAYRGLNADEMTEEDLLYAQEHLRILSGLYGVLRPLDAIQAYRLEMGTKIEIGEFKNLYRFWDNKITNSINNALGNSETIVNLASNEYFKSINRKKLNANVITPEFKEYKNGVVKMITVYAKNARGQMTSFIIKNRIGDPEQIKTFDINGYQFDVNSSDENRWVFIR